MSNPPKNDHRKTDRQVFPFYPLIFGIYPVLALAGFNIAEIDFSITYRSILLSLLLSAVLFTLLRLILQRKAQEPFGCSGWRRLLYISRPVESIRLGFASALGRG